MQAANRAKRLCGEIPGGDIKMPSGKTAIFYGKEAMPLRTLELN